jgi:hypothetical protein
MPLFEKFFASKLKFPKIPFGSATLKPYRKVNTDPKATINRAFWRKPLAKIYSASSMSINLHFLLNIFTIKVRFLPNTDISNCAHDKSLLN